MTSLGLHHALCRIHNIKIQRTGGKVLFWTLNLLPAADLGVRLSISGGVPMIHYVEIYDSAAAVDYVDRKLRLVQSGIAVDQRRAIASVVVESLKNEEPAPLLAPPEQLPPASTRQRNYLFQRANLDGPLIENESPVEEDFASFLLADFRGIPAGTVTLRRRTSHAEYYYFLTCVHVKDGQLRRIPMEDMGESDTLVTDDAQMLALPKPGDPIAQAIVPEAIPEVVYIWGDIALSLANALVGGIGKTIGTKVFDLLFGNMASVPSWFGEMYEKFVKAVYEALNEQWKKQIEVGILTVADEIDLYNKTGNKAQLQEAENLSVQLVQNIETYGPSLVANYVIAAGLQLLVLQQQALVAEDPAGYKRAIEERANRFVKLALTSRTKVIDDRMAKITKVEPRKVGQTQGWGFTDNATGERWWYPDIPGVGKSGKPNADRQHAVQTEKVRGAIDRDLEPVLLITADWLKLVQQPLPPHDGAFVFVQTPH
jgi:hypothetical protein